MRSYRLLGMLWLLGIAGVSVGGGRALPRSTPEEQGIASSSLHAFIDAADKQVQVMHSFILVRHGHVVAEAWWKPFSAESRHMLYSLSKSFTSTAVGLAVAEEKLKVDDTVLKYFPDEAPANPSENLKAMRIHDLLCMATGHESEPRLGMNADQPWTKIFLAHPVARKPGSHFLYNTPATYMQSAIVQKVTGQTVLDFLRPRLFEPLGIENPTWGASPQGISLGGYGLSIRTEDIAKFGQLYLQKGKWEGKQLVPASWVETATSKQIANGNNPKSDWNQGYGYQFWRSRHGAFRGDGAMGQFCIVLPEQDAVVAITSGTKDMQGVLNLVWDKLLPAMQGASLPANPNEHNQLKNRLATLAIPHPNGKATTLIASQVSGKTFVFAKNDMNLKSLSLHAGSGGEPTQLSYRSADGDSRVSCGFEEWVKGKLTAGAFANQPAAAAGAWTDDHTYVARICPYEMPNMMTLTLRFVDKTVSLEVDLHPQPGKRPAITGRVQ